MSRIATGIENILEYRAALISIECLRRSEIIIMSLSTIESRDEPSYAWDSFGYPDETEAEGEQNPRTG